MDYHIWMLYEALSNHYECEMVLKEQATQDLKNVRLYDQSFADDGNTLYVEQGSVMLNNDDPRVSVA